MGSSAAAAAAAAAQVFEENNQEVSKEEIKAAIAKAVELRALHAALMQGNSSPAAANLRLPNCTVSPSISRPSSQLSAQDYPVFTPSYEVEPLPAGYHHIQFDNQSLFENWDESGLIITGEEDEEDRNYLSDSKKGTSSLRKALPSFLFNRESHIFQSEDKSVVSSSCANHNITVLQTSPGADILKSSRRTASSGGDCKSITTCNKCKPATISSETDHNGSKSNNKNWVPLSDSHTSIQSQPKTKAPILSWIFPRLKRKHKSSNTSINQAEPEEMSQILKDLGIMSLESLKKELMAANENRDAALMEVAGMKSSLGELKSKLEHLETYCDELKKALKLTVQWKENQTSDRPSNLPKRGKSIEEIKRDDIAFMPLGHEVMVEGFVQIVSEARLSVKQFCKTLVGQMEEADNSLMEKLNSHLQPYKLNLKSKPTKLVLYHLEALINQSLYQDFENCTFKKNGSPKVLDPHQDRQAQFSSFVSLRNLSWNEVLRKGTKFYSEEFSRFCDQKMSCIISTLNWTRQWSEQLLQSFFVAAKCIWLLHLLAFSFNPPLAILRVEENRSFDALYMDDVSMERQKSQAPVGVKMMVTPGFYVHDRILRCKVLCTYRNVA